MERDADHWPPTAMPRAQRQQLGNQISSNANFKVPWENSGSRVVTLVRNKNPSQVWIPPSFGLNKEQFTQHVFLKLGGRTYLNAPKPLAAPLCPKQELRKTPT